MSSPAIAAGRRAEGVNPEYLPPIGGCSMKSNPSFSCIFLRVDFVEPVTAMKLG